MFSRIHFLLVAFCVQLMWYGSAAARSGSEVKEVHGVATLKVEENETRAHCTNAAIEQAKQAAIENAFGTVITSSSNLQVKNTQKGQAIESQTDFVQTSSSTVSGEWLDFTKVTKIETLVQGKDVYIRAEVWGTARKVTSDVMDIEVYTANGRTKQFRTDKFNVGAPFYLNYKAPKDGHVMIFMSFGNDSVYCMYPYTTLPYPEYKSFTFRAGVEYCFFDKQRPVKPEWEMFTQQLMPYTEGKPENQVWYVIFTSSFTSLPASLNKLYEINEDLAMPPGMSMKSFLKWKAEMMVRDADVQVKEHSVVVTPD